MVEPEMKRRVEILEWKSEMLLLKIAFITGEESAEAKMKELLKTMPEELKEDTDG